MASLEKSIKLMKSVDEHFLRTFIVLVLSWSAFVVEQLEKGVSSLSEKNSTGDCLFYLVILYLDSLDVRDMEIPDSTPGVCA
ncbi:hypothetical protein D1007_09268 [Hordeum vulgare]|nr:hypothetical protein D1007_09268 [Hordeum vulgare]